MEIQNTIASNDIKMEKHDELRVRKLQDKIENTHKLNELADNRMAQRCFKEAMENEMQYQKIEEKKQSVEQKLLSKLHEQ